MNLIDSFSLNGKIALITFPEQAYGEAIARGLAEAGAKVILAGKKSETLAICERMSKAGYTARAIDYAQRHEEEAKALAADIESAEGRLDIFVENGSNLILPGWKHSFEEIYDNFSVTQTGLMLTVKHIGMLMAKSGGGSVIFISDFAALVGEDVHNFDEAPEMFDKGFSLNYGYLKGCYVNYARQAAGYLGEHDVRCNCLAFGPLEGSVPLGYAGRFIKHSHLKRLMNADDVKLAVVFLASDASAYITGATIPVDGGYTAK